MVRTARASTSPTRGRTLDVAGVELRHQGGRLAVDGARGAAHARGSAASSRCCWPRTVRSCRRSGWPTSAWDAPVDDHTVEVAINRLRRKLGPAALALETTNRRGYRIADLTGTPDAGDLTAPPSRPVAERDPSSAASQGGNGWATPLRWGGHVTRDASRPRRRRQRHGRPPLRRGGPRRRASASATDIVVFGEEPRPAYDRVHLSSFFDDDAERPQPSPTPRWYAVQRRRAAARRAGARARPGRRALYRRPTGPCSRTSAACSPPAAARSCPPIPGTDAAGVFVYRTIEDLEAMRAWAIGRLHAPPPSSAAGCSASRRPTRCGSSACTPPSWRWRRA